MSYYQDAGVATIFLEESHLVRTFEFDLEQETHQQADIVDEHEVSSSSFSSFCPRDDAQADLCKAGPVVEQNTWQRNVFDVIDVPEAQPLGHARAEFIYVEINAQRKRHSSRQHGMTFAKNGPGCIAITSIDRKFSLFADTPLQRGDQIVSVDGVCCTGPKASCRSVTRLFRPRKGQERLSVIVRNRSDGRDTSLFTSCVEKRNTDDRAKISLAVNNKGVITARKIQADSLFAGSLLVPGHRCIEINGLTCELMRLDEAAREISAPERFMTITSRPGPGCAASVLGSGSAAAARNYPTATASALPFELYGPDGLLE